jgi:hypothetical protein
MGRPASAQGWQLETTPTVAQDLFRRWQTAMQQTAEPIPPARWWLREEGIGIRLHSDGRGTALSTTRQFKPTTVEINLPSDPGDVDSLTQFGRDPTGRCWLLRQGILNTKPRLDKRRFQNLTGLPRAFETPASGSSPARWWFRVCRLDLEDEFVRGHTVDFVRRCQYARETATSSNFPLALDEAVTLAGNLEPTGRYVIPPHDARVAERMHGEVVNELKQLLDVRGILARKVFCIDGYEVDLIVECRGSSRLLIEVKTGAIARDVQTGVGQLFLYRQLMPELRSHTPVLLLPTQPTAALASAVSGCGVILHFYEWIGLREDGQIRFSEDFLALCERGH